MDNYIINKNTIAIIGLDEKKCKIIDYYKEYIINENIIKYIEKNCYYYGSSYKGRLEASSFLLKKSYKMPIIIDNKDNLILFPTRSPDSIYCTWINIFSILRYECSKNNEVTLFLKNNKLLKLDIGKYSIQNNMLNAFLLLNNFN